MSLTKAQIIDGIKTERAEIVRTHPRHTLDINKLFLEFVKSFKKPEINTPSELFDLCPFVDQFFKGQNISPEILPIVEESRSKILKNLFVTFYDEQSQKLGHGDKEEANLQYRARQLSLILIDLVPLLRKHFHDNPTITEIDQNSLSSISNGNFNIIKNLLRDPHLKTYNWELFQSLLPSDLKTKFVVSYRDLSDSKWREKIIAYKGLIEKIGSDSAIQFLISSGVAQPSETSRLKRIISECLGEFTVKNFRLPDLMEIPAGLLAVQDIHNLFFFLLRNSVYRDLIAADAENTTITGTYKQRLKHIRSNLEQSLKKMLDTEITEQKKLFDEIFAYFEEVLSFEVPATLRTVFEDKHNQTHYFPSLRQRIAAHDLVYAPEGKRKKLIAFFMGLGKTASTFLAREMIQEKQKKPVKMLWICPHNIVETNQLPAEVAKFYKRGQQPSVKTITSGLSEDQTKEALTGDIVVVPYQMLTSETVEALSKQKFQMMVVDEAHNAKNLTGRNTKAIHKLLTTIPNLNDKGYLALLSGDPTPNRPDDIIAQLRLYDPERYKDATSLRASISQKHPFEIRNALLEFMILLDDPEKWEEYTKIISYDLSEAERNIYNTIYFDDSLTSGEKLARLNLAILNPSLYLQAPVQSALLTQTIAKLEEYFQTEEIIVVAENNLAEGLSRDHASEFGQSFLQSLRTHFGDKVDVLAHDGQTKQDLEQLASPKRKGKKTILFVQSLTIKEAINALSRVHRAILLEPTFNKGDTAQLVKRFAREGNTDVEVTIMVAKDSLHQGIQTHADEKYKLTTLLKHGGTLTEDDMAFLEGDDLAEAIRIKGRMVLVGTGIVDKIHTEYQKLATMHAHLRHRGLVHYQEFMENNGAYFAEMTEKFWEKSFAGNNIRFCAGIIKELETKGLIKGPQYLDLGASNLLLERTLGLTAHQQPRRIYSVEMSPKMIEEGRKALLRDHQHIIDSDRLKVAPFNQLQAHFGDETFDLINFPLAYEYTRINTKAKNPLDDERTKTLVELNRVCKPNGIVIFTLSGSTCTDDEFGLLRESLIKHFGFEMLPDYCGQGLSVDEGQDNIFSNRTIVMKKIGAVNLAEFSLPSLKMTRGISKDKDKLTGTTRKIRPNENKGFPHSKFTLNAVKLEFAPDPAELIEQQIYQRNVETARTLLQRVLNRNNLNMIGLTFTEEEQAICKQLNIFLQVDPLNSKLKFRLLPSERVELVFNEDKNESTTPANS